MEFGFQLLVATMISIPGIPTLPGAQPSLSGVRPTPGFTGTPRGPGNFHGQGNCQPSGRHHPSTVNDVALSGHSALPGLSASPGLSALPGQSSHSAIHVDTSLEVERAGPGRPPSSPVLPDQLSIFSLPWYLSPALGPSPPSRELGHPQTPMGSGEFSGQGQTPAIRQAPPLHFGGIRQFAQQDNGHHN